MRDVVDAALDVLREGHGAGGGVDADAGEGFVGECAEDAGDLGADGADDLEFLCEVAAVVGEGFGEKVFVAVGQRGLVFSDGAFDAIGTDDFEIGDVGNDFEGGPLAGDWPGEELVMRQAFDGVAK